MKQLITNQTTAPTGTTQDNEMQTNPTSGNRRTSWSALQNRCLATIGAAALCIAAGCTSPCPDSPFAKYDAAKEVQRFELKRTSESWDGAQLPDYLQGKPELVVMRYVFPVGSKLPWHHHPVINYGILQQGELTIVGLDGKRQVVRAGDAIVEMVGPIHCGMNTGDKPIVLDMFYLAQEGMPLAVQHPEVQKPME